MCNSDAPIAVIDSGVGGISVLKELIRFMPCENYIYFGDNKNAPYGTKTAEYVRRLMFENAQYLMKCGAKALVIACNTATGAAAKELREMYPKFPIIGIEPAIKPSASYKKDASVLVMATPLTLKQEKFTDLLNKFSDNVNIATLPCSGLMELIEEGKTEGWELEEFLKELFASLGDKKFDSVVLGCTHYSHIKETIKKLLGSEIMIFDGGEGTARETKRRLAEIGMLNTSEERGYLRIECSDEENNIEKLAKKLLNMQTTAYNP